MFQIIIKPYSYVYFSRSLSHVELIFVLVRITVLYILMLHVHDVHVLDLNKQTLFVYGNKNCRSIYICTLPRFSWWKMSEVGLPVGGYPTEIFKNGFDCKVLCNACNRVLRDPVQSYCGHRFCRECISAIIRWGSNVYGKNIYIQNY